MQDRFCRVTRRRASRSKIVSANRPEFVAFLIDLECHEQLTRAWIASCPRLALIPLTG
jgi:hypothetical protein